MSKERPENLELTSASEIRKLSEKRSAGSNIKLPSGIVVCIRNPLVSELITSGVIPNDLLALALGQENILEDVTPEGAKKSVRLMNILVVQSVVSPKIVEADPKEGEILISDLSEGDKAYIVGEAQSEVGKLKPFRKNEGKQGADRPAVQKIPKQETK